RGCAGEANGRRIECHGPHFYSGPRAFEKAYVRPFAQSPMRPTDPGLLATLAGLFEEGGIDLAAWGLAWAKVAPLIAIVPAFGLRALSVPVRAATALVLAAVIVPSLRPAIVGPAPMPVLLLTAIARGTVVA